MVGHGETLPAHAIPALQTYLQLELKLAHLPKVALSLRYSPGMLTLCLHCRLERQFG